MNQYLIAVSVGPVQEFIASARKLRDLWYGSYLLSERSKAVARFFHENGCELVFPADADFKDLEPGSRMNVANKILVLSPAGLEPADLVRGARQAFADHWREVCQQALVQARRQVNIDEELFNRQIDDFGEFFAAWYPYDPNSYAACRREVENRLNGRKNLRNFSAPSWNGGGKPKSSLDGIRESVLTYTGTGRQPRSFMLKQGEHLDALGIVKRFGPWDVDDRPYFDNFAQVAVQPYLAGLREAAVADPDIAAIISRLPSNDELYSDTSDIPKVRMDTWDGWPENLLPELLHPAVLEQEKNQEKDGGTHPAWEMLEKYLRMLWKKTAEPHPYAALLLGDGDRMGEALDSIQKISKHQQFSRELDEFARLVHETVEVYNGKVIYSGGDDVMAYVPLSRVIDCAGAINALFGECMVKACRDTAIEKVPTFSIGLAIVHQRTPLFEALNQARKAERCAKLEGGRNALALIQDKRSGSELMVTGKWLPDGDLQPLAERLQTFIDGYECGWLSSRLGYQLRALEKEYGTTAARLEFTNGLPGNVLAAETLRFIRHKEKAGGMSTVGNDIVSIIGGQLDLRKLSDEMIISRQLYQSFKLSKAGWIDGKGEKRS